MSLIGVFWTTVFFVLAHDIIQLISAVSLCLIIFIVVFVWVYEKKVER